MKTIGLIGGMSWESTVPYYRIINETVKARLGGLHSARILLHSVDFHEVAQLQRDGNWPTAGVMLGKAAKGLETAGADILVLCTNTMHKVAADIESAVRIPLIHIADPTGEQIRQTGFGTVGLLGTRFTMEQDFYKDRLRQRHGLQVRVPDAHDRELVHRIIYEELCVGQIRSESRREFRRVMAQLVAHGAQAIILGCTEISLLVSAQDATVPLYDTAMMHAVKAAELALVTD
ncbi:aspartate/glutamate racemase family protein [Azohydromonas lata]|uniref:aspartate/glutamate racemase family protein n=1 Tax=Azohydromonas lata TaxID=45677 RepID=UPI0008361D81|nr:aspartate/glutamate racemase family protein [Azohydromonas lata]